jgi:DnaK suppressor protein
MGNIHAVRRKLEDELTRIEEAIAHADASAGTVTLDQSSVGRLSRMDALQQQAMAQGLRQRMAGQKRKLMAALERIDQGTYGLCCECGTAIAQARLDRDLAAVFCEDCAESRAADEGKR